MERNLRVHFGKGVVITRKRKNILHTKKRKKEKVKVTKTVKPEVSQYRGVYKKVSYDSCLELACLIHCSKLGLKIRQFDLNPIGYFDPTRAKERKYFPDFIIEDFLIIEVKWIGFVFKKKFEQIESKRLALEAFCRYNPQYTSLFVTNKMIPKEAKEAAREYHKRTYGESRSKPK